MKQAYKKIKYLMLFLIKNVGLTFILLFVFLVVPVFVFIKLKEIFQYLGLFYQVFGIYLLYIDERYKMNRGSMRYPKFNTIWFRIIESPLNSFLALKLLYSNITNPPKKDSDIKLSLSRQIIDDEYDEIDDFETKLKAQLISFESDLSMLSYFSNVRQAGYIFLSTGFILQFIAIKNG